jgi:DnaJ-class molecular chaperone
MMKRTMMPSEGGQARPGDEVPPGTPQSGEAICPRCGGAGKLADETPCEDCGGTGKVTQLVGDA